jgi:hypothetical protein
MTWELFFVEKLNGGALRALAYLISLQKQHECCYKILYAMAPVYHLASISNMLRDMNSVWNNQRKSISSEKLNGQNTSSGKECTTDSGEVNFSNILSSATSFERSSTS